MASNGDFDLVAGDTRLRVEGLGRTLRQLSQAGADAEDMKALMHSIGMLVVLAANPPVVTGQLQGTIRAGRGKTKAVVRAGGARAPYAGVLEYGWPARNIEPQHYLTNALQAQRGAILAMLDQGLGELLRQNDLT